MHDPAMMDCPLSQPCRWATDGEHKLAQDGLAFCRNYPCTAGNCICERLRAHGKRVLAEAREAVAAISSMDAATVQSEALAAIDRIIEERP